MTPAQAARRQSEAPSADDMQAVEIKLIHIGRGVLKLDEESYRGLISGVCDGRTTSSKGLTAGERQEVLRRMRDLGFVPKPQRTASGPAAVALIRDAQLRKLRALWYALADVGAVARPANAVACNAAVAAWAEQRLPHLAGATTLEGTAGAAALWVADGDDRRELIEQAKKWCARVGAKPY